MATAKPKLITIVGPTAAGKSALALKLAKRHHGVIICADSRQVYRYMNIGTNKPTRQERSVVPHRGLDLVRPDQPFSLSDFISYALEQCKVAWMKGQTPFIVGGTGLYVTALVEGYDVHDAKPPEKLRKSLEEKSTQALAKQLTRLSPALAEKTDLRNRRRLIRAIERLHSGVEKTTKTNPSFQTLQLGVTMDTAKLYERINQRVDEMISRGLISEVKRLAKRYDWSLPAMSGIGYRQIGQWLRGEISRSEAIELIKRDTRHYAKRQMTWYRKHRDIQWVQSVREADQALRGFLKS